MTTSGKPSILRLVLVSLAICLLALFPSGSALADDHEESGSEMDMGDDGDSDSDADMGDMQMGATVSWQDQVNKVSYPTTAVLALLAVWVCVLLMRATGMVDKFGLISIGLGLFVVQAIFGVIYYVSDGDLVTMPTVMFVMSLATSLALLLMGVAFYRWQRMIK